MTLLGRTTVNVVVGVAVLYTLLPVLWLVLAATKDVDALFNSDLFGNFAFVENVKNLFAMDKGLYGRWYVNSILYAVIGAATSAFISIAAYRMLLTYQRP